MHSGIASIPLDVDETMQVGYIMRNERRPSDLLLRYIDELHAIIGADPTRGVAPLAQVFHMKLLLRPLAARAHAPSSKPRASQLNAFSSRLACAPVPHSLPTALRHPQSPHPSCTQKTPPVRPGGVSSACSEQTGLVMLLLT